MIDEIVDYKKNLKPAYKGYILQYKPQIALQYYGFQHQVKIFNNKDIIYSKEIKAEGFWQNTKKQFRKNKLAKYSWRFILVMLIIALLADILANEKPLICSYKNKTYFPFVFSSARLFAFAKPIFWLFQMNCTVENFPSKYSLLPSVELLSTTKISASIVAQAFSTE